MDKLELKKQLIHRQNQLIETLKKDLSTIKTSSDMDDENTKDPEDFSHQDESEGKVRSIELRIEQAEQTLIQLRQLPFGPNQIVEMGALVRIGVMHLLVGVSFPDFMFENQKIIGISEQAPIYNTIKNLKQNDAYQFNGKSFAIDTIL